MHFLTNDQQNRCRTTSVIHSNVTIIFTHTHQTAILQSPWLLSACGFWTETPSKGVVSEESSTSVCVDRPREIMLAVL